MVVITLLCPKLTCFSLNLQNATYDSPELEILSRKRLHKLDDFLLSSET